MPGTWVGRIDRENAGRAQPNRGRHGLAPVAGRTEQDFSRARAAPEGCCRAAGREPRGSGSGKSTSMPGMHHAPLAHSDRDCAPMMDAVELQERAWALE